MAAPGAVGKFALVLLEEGAPLAAAEIYGELARLLGRVRYDVIGAFRRSPGIPFEDLDGGQAEAAVRMLADSGVRAAAVPAERLPPFPKIYTVHKAIPARGSLSVQTDYVGTMQELPWDQVAALSAATLPGGSAPAGSGGGPSVGTQIASAVAWSAAVGVPLLPSFHQMKRSAAGHPPRPPEPCEVLALAPFDAPVEMRFRANELNYEFLGERMTGSSGGNFRAFAGDLLRGAARARVSAAARALAEGGSPPPLGADEFGRHNRWLKLLAVAGLE
jgi:hypothetical protein